MWTYNNMNREVWQYSVKYSVDFIMTRPDQIASRTHGKTLLRRGCWLKLTLHSPRRTEFTFSRCFEKISICSEPLLNSGKSLLRVEREVTSHLRKGFRQLQFLQILTRPQKISQLVKGAKDLKGDLTAAFSKDGDFYLIKGSKYWKAKRVGGTVVKEGDVFVDFFGCPKDPKALGLGACIGERCNLGSAATSSLAPLATTDQSWKNMLIFSHCYGLHFYRLQNLGKTPQNTCPLAGQCSKNRVFGLPFQFWLLHGRGVNSVCAGLNVDFQQN